MKSPVISLLSPNANKGVHVACECCAQTRRRILRIVPTKCILTPQAQVPYDMAYYSNESTVITDPTVFDASLDPSSLVGREKEFAVVTTFIDSVYRVPTASHLWMYGPAGSGKTSLVRLALVASERTKTNSAFINCGEEPTYYAVLDRICNELRLLRSEQQSTSAKLRRLRQRWGQQPFFVVLDEIDMMAPKERQALLYGLANSGKVGLVAISYKRNSLSSLDSRVRSRLTPKILMVKPYSRSQLLTILISRAQQGLYESSWNTGVLRRIASLSDSDARMAIRTLGAAAFEADRAGAETLTTEHVRAAWTDLTAVRQERLAHDLNLHQRLILDIVRRKATIRSAELKTAYGRACRSRHVRPVATRTFLLYVNRLVRYRLIEEEYVVDRGRHRVLKAKQISNSRATA